MKNKVLALGLRTNQKNNVFSGQAMMFDALVEGLTDNNFKVDVVDLSSRYLNIKVGRFSLVRMIEYILIVLKAVPVFFKNRGSTLYITTAQTKSGFLRDLIFVSLGWVFNYKIVLHQFGANFGSFYDSLSPFMKSLVRYAFNKGDYIIVEGDVTKRSFFFIKDFEKKVVSITNGLPEKTLLNSGKGKGYKNDRVFNLIYLSYLIESKGYWDVLQAVNILVNEYQKDVHCVFAGTFKQSVDATLHSNEREAKKAFFQFISDNNLENNITYYEGLMGKEKAEAFQNSHAFLLPSYFKFEGQPVSVVEAMAYGAVPIVTKYRMIPNMVTNEIGLFVNKKSPVEIAEKVLYLMNNQNVYANLSQAGVDRFLQFYTLEKYIDSMIGLILKGNK